MSVLLIITALALLRLVFLARARREHQKAVSCGQAPAVSLRPYFRRRKTWDREMAALEHRWQLHQEPTQGRRAS
jgi:hypothetical protein